MRPLTPARDIGLLIARALLGFVVAAHGYQKFFMNGMDATATAFEGMGVPLPAVSAWAAGLIELVGGILLILGALTPIVGILVTFVMIGAAVFVHIGNGIFASDGGWELVAVIALAAMTFALVGPGRYSVDHALTGRRGDSVDAKDADRTVETRDSDRVGATAERR
ncbi:DoxX family protein [Mobilicoccus caccae]|uniref:Oxidoreductase n=1 Tax=Mobilicoccus caccae TaxID=1859295 RepID=A0ABQ6ILT0_9MICO|nr:DoxX family protein [Mobilicoccus caccae]GMA38391.1 hypothetical protein GCM10025883_04360 [Mobilicoccus caccae]